jgi:NYN domain
MKREAGGPCLSVVFVDYDNIYMSLKRKSEEAAKRFAKDATSWLREIENGRLITPTNASFGAAPRRIVMNRCYGNPVPRRNPHDNSTDMNSFPFVRHHFLRAGFEVIDCPPLTAQLKNSADIRMVMDVRDLLMHDTYFDEFIILSGDADFTPVLIRLRAHARRTVIFANEFTAAPYTAICDGEVRETNLIELILAGELPDNSGEELPGAAPRGKIEDARRAILAEVVAGVRASAAPVPLEALADRALRALGHEKTIATGWAGAGSFRELLRRNLPEEIRLTGEPPYLAFDAKRHLDEPAPRVALEVHDVASEIGAPGSAAQIAAAAPEPLPHFEPAPIGQRPAAAGPAAARRPALEGPPAPSYRPPPLQQEAVVPQHAEAAAPLPRAPAPQQPAAPAPQRAEAPSAIQQSIARIQEACQAPPMAPPEYRLLFEIMAKEINDNDLIGAQTLTNITQRAQERGLDVRRDDVRFVLEVVSEADPWFEQGASANLFAGRFRNFVVARCRGQGLNLSADELDLIDAWFAGGALPQSMAPKIGATPAAPAIAVQPSPAQPAATEGRASRWWSLDDGRSHNLDQRTATPTTAPASGTSAGQAEEFPRIVRTRLRG